MPARHRTFSWLLPLIVAFAASAAAQPAQGPDPSKDEPLRFSAFAVSLQAGMSGTVEIAIERWSTDEERARFLTIIAEQGQDKLIDVLQDIKERCGFIRLPQTLGWDIKYAKEFWMPDGTRQIVIVTDKPVSFLAARNDARVMDYPFTMLELRLGNDNTGEGKMLVAASIEIKNGRLEIENFGQQPVRLTHIEQRRPGT